MKEYDFRFPGLRVRTNDPRDAARIRQVRDALLDAAGGFTEIAPDAGQLLVPGDGVGYIVALGSASRANKLRARLASLAAQWDLPAPRLIEASKGPRRSLCHFLIPEQANPDNKGQRRPLFTPERWARIHAAIEPWLSHPVLFVYGEWMPPDSWAEKSVDVSRLYCVRRQSKATEARLRRFIQTRVFDGGRECDQWCIYLSVRGRTVLVKEK